METIITEKVKENLNKLKEEDRRFLMNVINQNVQNLQSRHQFKMTFLVSYFAVYLSIIAISFRLEKVYFLYILTTIIFCVFIFFLFYGGREGKLIRLQSEVYRPIQEVHFNYLNHKKKK